MISINLSVILITNRYKSPIALKKNITIKETPVFCLFSSTFNTEKDIEISFLPNKITEIYTELEPPKSYTRLIIKKQLKKIKSPLDNIDFTDQNKNPKIPKPGLPKA